MTTESRRMAMATWKVTLDGADLTERLRPRLISLSLRECRGEEADQVDIVVSDHDGALETPRSGVEIEVQMGWARGTDLPIGLIDKGTFKVDEGKITGPPDQLTIRARGADFTDALRKRKERSFVGKTVGHIITAIAADNGLTALVAASLSAQVIPALGGGAISDIALLRALGRRYDAVATIKKRRLIFAPIGKGQTASGKTLTSVEIDRSDTTGSFDYERIERDNYTGVEAVWYDKASATRKTVTVGDGGSSKARRLRKVYANEADARAAARAEFNRKSRGKAKLSLSLAYGRPDIGPDSPVTVTGFKAEINAQKWIVTEATHTMDGDGGLMTQLQLESN